MVKAPWLGWSLLAVACSAQPAEQPRTAAAAPAAAALSAEPEPAAPAASTAPAAAAPAFRSCGKLGCKAFPSAEAAFDYVLSEKPRILAVGEAHAQKDGPRGATTVQRFMDSLLPHLVPRASDLIIELLLANGSCGQVEKKVDKQTKAVTAPQAANNQNQYLALGDRAKALRIQPQALVPSCEQLERIANAGDNDVVEMLQTVKAIVQRDVAQLLAKRGPERLIVSYGGLLHNDLVPREGLGDASFGPALARASEGRYIELDLVMPEQIRETKNWQDLPWYPHYAREKAPNEAYLFSWAPHAYALVFPASIEPETQP